MHLNSNLNDTLILLVEDKEEDRKLLIQILSKYFTKILEAENGKIAYEIFKENKDIDIIISDIDMPEVNGIDLLKLVRMSDLQIPFIITTAQISSEVLLRAIEFNVSSFLLKPIDLSKLLEKVDILCEQKIIEKKLIFKQQEIEYYNKAVDKVSLIYKMYENGDITYMNDSMKQISKYDDEDIKNLNFCDIIHPDIPQKYIDDTWNQIKNSKFWRGNTKFISKDKEVFYLNNTIFKIHNSEEDEYITISFLNTKENLEKRDFHKKVLINIKDAHKKEAELKKTIISLNTEIDNYKDFIANNSNENLEKVESKLLNREKQIKILELEISDLNSKYEKMLINKRDEIEHHINTVQKHKMETDNVKEKVYKQNEEIEATHKKIKSLSDSISRKNKLIKDLKFIISDTDNK